MAGRPTKLNAIASARIIKAIRDGANKEDAARVGGVDPDTINNWLNRGQREKSGDFFAFFGAYKRAEAELMEEASARVRKAGRRTWQAAAWLLERRRPKEYGRNVRVEHTGEDGAPIKTQNANLTVATAEVIPADVLPDDRAEMAIKKFFGVPLAVVDSAEEPDGDDTGTASPTVASAAA